MDRPITALKGIGPKRAELFERLEIHTCADLLRFFPREYRDFSRVSPVNQAIGACSVQVILTSAPKTAYIGGGRTVVSVRAEDASGRLNVVWFNQPYMAKNIAQGGEYYLCGRVERSETNAAKMVNPMVFDGAHSTPGILPVYRLTAGLNQSAMRKAVHQALATCDFGCDPLPQSLRVQFGLMEQKQAYFVLHEPQNITDLHSARRRFALEDILFYLVGMRLISGRRSGCGISFAVAGAVERFCSMLPFVPTAAQRRAMEEIAADMHKNSPMNRLVQGDVGSGKTAVAFFALWTAWKNGFQAVLLAPTEILARQHFEKIRQLFPEMEAALLLGGMPSKARAQCYEDIATGAVKVIVGTHALFQQGVTFRNLALIVADEQHRFGVRQRAMIAQKAAESSDFLGKPSMRPDVLVLSATPIPRSLSLVLYGDMDASVIDELPPGRKPVISAVVPPVKRMAMYGYVAQKAAAGEQTYVVCPLIEDSEEMEAHSALEVFSELHGKLLKDVSVGLLHGRMSSEEKQAVLDDFRTGKTKVLVSTTVVEVGVDVPNATTMIVESAERFGLAQLHQLRGRVGRGEKPARCFFSVGTAGKEAAERMRVLCATTDGFAIAMEDLRQRGPGAFLGTEQSGFDDAGALALLDGMDTLQEGQLMAQGVLDGTLLTKEEQRALLDHIRRALESRMTEIAMN